MINKRGQGLSTSTIVLLILGVAVLVLLIIGFTMGWSNMKDKFLGSSNNVDTIAQACATACSTNSVYDYCTVERELKIEKDVGAFKNKQLVTCKNLSSELSFGIQNCSSICA